MSRISRRRFVQAGSLGLMLDLPGLLWARAPGNPAASPRTPERSCIFIVQGGGPSHIDILDLKPDAPDGIRGPFRPIATSVPGMQICELLPQMAKVANCFSLIRSVSHKANTHDLAPFLSGQSKPEPNAPYYGSVLSRFRPSTQAVPSYVWLHEAESDAGAGWRSGGSLGPAHAPLLIGRVGHSYGHQGFRVRAFDSGVEPDRLQGRLQLLQEFNTSGSGSWNSELASQFRRLQERAGDLVSGPVARRAFDLELEPAKVRDRYGRNVFGQNLLAARRMVEAGVRLVSIYAFMGHHPNESYREFNTWDMHGTSGPGIFGSGGFGLRWVLPRMDQAVSALLEDLQARGMLESTLVVLAGEMGRTPRIQTFGVATGRGRDHWSECYSALLAGGGIRGGSVYGASDRIAAYVKDHPVSLEAFAATLFHALGVLPETPLSSPDGRPRPVSTGRPVLALF